MNKEEVREYVEEAQSIIDEYPQMNEANTKAAILRPLFLKRLDWGIPQNTQLEYSVKAFGKTYRVDYALLLEGTPVAFLEAKGIDTPLTEKHREQIKAYLKNEDVNLGILTNAEEYEFYRRRVIDSKVNVNTLAKISLQNLPERVTILEAFTKDAIQTDEWETILDRLSELEEARDTLEEKKEQLASEFTDVLTDSASEKISSQAESQAKEMIDRLISDIEAEIDTDESIENLPPDNEDSPQIELDEEFSGKYIIEIQDGSETLVTVSDDVQSDVMADAVDYLIENNSLISKIEPLPYIPGRKKAIINDNPSSPHDEDAMRAYRELTGEYYLDTHDNKGGKKRTIRTLTEECGLEVSFVGEW